MKNELNNSGQALGDSDTNTDGVMRDIDVDAQKRRRFFKRSAKIAAPVVATLVSRPVLAWHCRTPSMWGSLVLDVNLKSSLRANDDHKTGYKDETWYISDNWLYNSARSATGVADRPWVYLLKYADRSKFAATSLVGANVGSSNPSRYAPYPAGQNPTRYLDIQSVTVGELVAATGIALPTGVSGSSKVYTVLNAYTSFGAHLIVAQLNFKLLYPLKTNLLEVCFTEGDLRQMASGSYQPTDQTSWGPSDIVSYLQNNWVVLPNSSFSPTTSGKYYNFPIVVNSQP